MFEEDSESEADELVSEEDGSHKISPDFGIKGFFDDLLRKRGLNFETLQSILNEEEKLYVLQWDFSESLEGQEDSFERFFNLLAEVIITKKKISLS